jgi:hypothetical protein
MAGFCEYSNECLVFVKDREFVDQLSMLEAFQGL